MSIDKSYYYLRTFSYYVFRELLWLKSDSLGFCVLWIYKLLEPPHHQLVPHKLIHFANNPTKLNKHKPPWVGVRWFIAGSGTGYGRITLSGTNPPDKVLWGHISIFTRTYGKCGPLENKGILEFCAGLFACSVPKCLRCWIGNGSQLSVPCR